MRLNFASENKKKRHMTNEKTIGELIKLEVLKQGIPIKRFAEMIYCQRNNVYN